MFNVYFKIRGNVENNSYNGFFLKLFLVSYDVNYSVRLNCVYYILWILKVFLVSVLRILNIDYMIDMKCNMRYDNI